MDALHAQVQSEKQIPSCLLVLCLSCLFAGLGVGVLVIPFGETQLILARLVPSIPCPQFSTQSSVHRATWIVSYLGLFAQGAASDPAVERCQQHPLVLPVGVLKRTILPFCPCSGLDPS